MDKLFIRVKGGASKPLDADKVDYGGVTVRDLIDRYDNLLEKYNDLIQTLSKSVVLETDQTYLVAIDKEVRRINASDILPNQKLKHADKLYEIVNKKIQLKKGVIL